MKLSEFKSRWDTGSTRPITIEIIGAPCSYKMEEKIHRASMGEFITQYITHLNTPRYRRDSDWSYVKNKMARVLNTITIEWTSA
jgi:hypothetical protein